MSDPGPSFSPPPEDEPKHDLMVVVRQVHNTKQSAVYEGLTITPSMARCAMSRQEKSRANPLQEGDQQPVSPTALAQGET